ncbi:MAG: LysR family transcriptional regulator [Desulfobacteraceae bacterium]|nr:LysR family transcriptional regulator [Desulfobacteraceae bacterium]
MELYQINSFIAVADALNLTRAAKNTNQSPSAVSSQIKLLEAHLNVFLFKRTPRGMTLTPEGETLLIAAKKVIHASQNLEQEAMDLQENLSGNLNIGINTDPVFLNISGISQTMAQTMPKIKISFIETQTFATAQMLTSRQIDLGFHFGEFKDPQICSLPLSRVMIRVVLPANLAKRNEAAPLERLVKLPWVWTRHSCPFHMAFKEQLDQLNLTLTPVADAVDENIVNELVKSGTGAALMREDQALELVKQNLAKLWQGPGMEIPLALACLEKRKKEKTISAFARAITQIHSDGYR